MAVFGVGGIGLNCVQGGVLAGAAPIIAVDVNPQKLELARRFGATHVVDASRDDALAAVRDLTARRRRLHASSASATWPSSARRSTPSRPAGRSPSSACRASAPRSSWWCTASTTTRRILGCRYGAARPRRDFPMLADLYLAGRLRIDELITDRYPLDDFDRALHDLEDGRLARGVFQRRRRRTEESTPWDASGRTSSTPTDTAATCRTGRPASPPRSSPSGRSAASASRSSSPTSPASASRRPRARRS